MKKQIELGPKEMSRAIESYLAAKGYSAKSLYIGVRDGEIKAIASEVSEKEFNDADIIRFMKNY